MKKCIKIFTLLFLLIVFIPSVYAIPETKNRSNEANLGVNKNWKITESKKTHILNTPYVDTSLKIYDFSDVLSDEEETELRQLSNEFTNKFKTDLVIVTYNLPYSYDSQNEDFAADFYDYNDFGLDFKYYSGVLLFRNTYENDPYFDMYCFGSAQLYFDSGRFNTILDGIYNELHAGQYLDGFKKFISYVDAYYEHGIPSSMKKYYIVDNGPGAEKNYYLAKSFSPNIFFMIMVSAGVTAITMSILAKKNKMIVKATQASEYLNKESFKLSTQKDTLINTVITHHRIQSSSGGGGGGSSFGSSGGGHSSGGGRHG